MLSPTDLNRIKIKDMIAAIKEDYDLDNPIHLTQIDLLNLMTRSALEKAKSEDVKKVEKLFINRKLGIKYYPAEDRKVMKDGKVVPIDCIYGSENA